MKITAEKNLHHSSLSSKKQSLLEHQMNAFQTYIVSSSVALPVKASISHINDLLFLQEDTLQFFKLIQCCSRKGLFSQKIKKLKTNFCEKMGQWFRMREVLEFKILKGLENIDINTKIVNKVGGGGQKGIIDLKNFVFQFCAKLHKDIKAFNQKFSQYLESSGESVASDMNFVNEIRRISIEALGNLDEAKVTSEITSSQSNVKQSNVSFKHFLEQITRHFHNRFYKETSQSQYGCSLVHGQQNNQFLDSALPKNYEKMCYLIENYATIIEFYEKAHLRRYQRIISDILKAEEAQEVINCSKMNRRKLSFQKSINNSQQLPHHQSSSQTKEGPSGYSDLDSRNSRPSIKLSQDPESCRAELNTKRNIPEEVYLGASLNRSRKAQVLSMLCLNDLSLNPFSSFQCISALDFQNRSDKANLVAGWQRDCCGVLDFVSKKYERVIKDCMDRNQHILRQQKQFQANFEKDQVNCKRDRWLKQNGFEQEQQKSIDQPKEVLDVSNAQKHSKVCSQLKSVAVKKEGFQSLKSRQINRQAGTRSPLQRYQHSQENSHQKQSSHNSNPQTVRLKMEEEQLTASNQPCLAVKEFFLDTSATGNPQNSSFMRQQQQREKFRMRKMDQQTIERQRKLKRLSTVGRGENHIIQEVKQALSLFVENRFKVDDHYCERISISRSNKKNEVEVLESMNGHILQEVDRNSSARKPKNNTKGIQFDSIKVKENLSSVKDCGHRSSSRMNTECEFLKQKQKRYRITSLNQNRQYKVKRPLTESTVKGSFEQKDSFVEESEANIVNTANTANLLSYLPLKQKRANVIEKVQRSFEDSSENQCQIQPQTLPLNSKSQRHPFLKSITFRNHRKAGSNVLVKENEECLIITHENQKGDHQRKNKQLLARGDLKIGLKKTLHLPEAKLSRLLSEKSC